MSEQEIDFDYIATLNIPIVGREEIEAILNMTKGERFMKIKELQKEAHNDAKEKGWWEQERSAAEIYALIHSEISEAVECARNGEPPVWYFRGQNIEGYPQNGEKPLGELIELADVVIRILDWSQKRNYTLKVSEPFVKDDEFEGFNHLEVYNYFHETLACKNREDNERMHLEYFIGQIWSWCIYKQWDLWKAVRCKMDYNKTRPIRHGGKKH